MPFLNAVPASVGEFLLFTAYRLRRAKTRYELTEEHWQSAGALRDGDAMMPGSMMATRTLKVFISWARASLSASNANLEAV
jgi:hypothetical protein